MTDLSKLKVLVVEDQAIIRLVLCMNLRKLGITNITQANDGIEALEHLRGSTFDLITSDIRMPNMGGLDLLQAIKGNAATKDIPVLMVSSETQKEIIVRAALYGASGYLLKDELSTSLRRKINIIFEAQVADQETS